MLASWWFLKVVNSLLAQWNSDFIATLRCILDDQVVQSSKSCWNFWAGSSLTERTRLRRTKHYQQQQIIKYNAYKADYAMVTFSSSHTECVVTIFTAFHKSLSPHVSLHEDQYLCHDFTRLIKKTSSYSLISENLSKCSNCYNVGLTIKSMNIKN